jgi:hypothetical protein
VDLCLFWVSAAPVQFGGIVLGELVGCQLLWFSLGGLYTTYGVHGVIGEEM